jgi:hypothetical protein
MLFGSPGIVPLPLLHFMIASGVSTTAAFKEVVRVMSCLHVSGYTWVLCSVATDFS